MFRARWNRLVSPTQGRVWSQARTSLTGLAASRAMSPGSRTRSSAKSMIALIFRGFFRTARAAVRASTGRAATGAGSHWQKASLIRGQSLLVTWAVMPQEMTTQPYSMKRSPSVRLAGVSPRHRSRVSAGVGSVALR